MNTQSPLKSVSKINNNLFISGIYPLETFNDTIKKEAIQCIVCCVKKSEVYRVHSKLTLETPNLIIMYIPYNDSLKQNLWAQNCNTIEIDRCGQTLDQFCEIVDWIAQYENKPLIEIGYHFINQSIEKGLPVLVHCMAGISRSVSLVTYYLMKKYNLSYEQALSYIKKKRPIACPNQSFQSQLKSCETRTI